MAQQPTMKIVAKELAFWETLFDIEPACYLKRNDTVQIIGSFSVYGGIHGDKEYYKVRHQSRGIGYMLKEGLEEVHHG